MKFERLGDIAKIQIGKTPPRADSRFWGKGNLWVSIADLKEQTVNETKEEITDFAVSKCGCKLLPKGTLLMSFKLSIGKLAFAGSDLYTNEAICGILLNDSNRYAIEYLYYALKNTKLTGSNVAVKGATLNTASLNALFIPIVGNKATQLHIAKILSQAEGLIAQRRESIRLLDEYLKSVFLEMFGDPANNFKNWKMDTLSNSIISVKNGLTRRGKNSKGEMDIVLRLKDIRSNFIEFKDLDRITLNEKEKRYFHVEKNDLLFIRVNGNPDYVGRCAIFKGYSEPVYYNDHIIRVRIDCNNLNPTFLTYFLNSSFGKSEISKYRKTSAGQYTINQIGLGNIKLYIPEISFQTQFAQIVEKTEALKAQYQQSLQELENLYGSLSQRAFRGELNPKDGEVKYLEGLESGVAAEPKGSYRR